VPKPYSAITLDQYRADTYALNSERRALNSERRALLRAALTVIKVDPYDALDVFPVHLDRSEGWDQYVLSFPERRGELVFEVDEVERVIVLRSVAWR
jgi:hypothetical protein